MTRERSYWPDQIGRLVLVDELAKVCARYDDPLTGETYRAGREQGGGRRGWWVQGVDESVRSDGYRDFAPRSQCEAIHELRTIASVAVGTDDWATVEIELD